MLTGSGYVYTRRAMHKIYRKYIEIYTKTGNELICVVNFKKFRWQI